MIGSTKKITTKRTRWPYRLGTGKFAKRKQKKNGVRRSQLRNRQKFEPLEFINPRKKEKGSTFAQSKDYKYFWGHVVKEIADQMPEKRVICWFDEHNLSLKVCAYNKFVREKRYCKRCTLFQGDVHAQALKDLIVEWEKDDLEE